MVAGTDGQVRSHHVGSRTASLNALALTTFPAEAAATRFRLLQLVPWLASEDIHLTVRPMLDGPAFSSLYRRSAWPRTTVGLLRGALRRGSDIALARRADVVVVQREAMLFGPPVVEWAATALGCCPLVLDLDDATYVSYVSPTYGRLAQMLKWPGKTDALIRRASVVTCGNPTVAAHVSSLGSRARVVPTVVDTDRFRPLRPRSDVVERPVVGWIGSHSTYPYLERILPVLGELADRHEFMLKVVGAGDRVQAPTGVELEVHPWRLDREVADFQSLDVGLYPLADDPWSAGKSGLKAIQYMAVGVPFVVSDVAGGSHVGEPGTTHLTARSADEWADALARLLADPQLRVRMGDAGRRHVLRHYTVPATARTFADALREAVAG